MAIMYYEMGNMNLNSKLMKPTLSKRSFPPKNRFNKTSKRPLKENIDSNINYNVLKIRPRPKSNSSTFLVRSHTASPPKHRFGQLNRIETIIYKECELLRSLILE